MIPPQHKIRELAVRQRKSLLNQIRGLIAEYGIRIEKSVSPIRYALPVLQENNETRLPPIFKAMLAQLLQQLTVLTRGHNRACVAYANKMARIAWAIN